MLFGEKLNKAWQCALGAQKATRTLVCIPSIASRAREGILPLCSVLVRPPGSPVSKLCSPQHRRDMDLLERDQRMPQRLSEGWDTFPMKAG